MRTVYLDGRYLRISDQILKGLTPGAFHAQGVFETMLGVDGKVLDVPAHLKRLSAGLKILGLKTPKVNSFILEKVLGDNQLDLGRVRLMVWRAGGRIHVMASALPYQISSKRSYKACLVKTGRPATSRWANLKSLDCGFYAHAYAQAQARGYDEALLLNKAGHILEATRANIFWMEDDRLYTPPLVSGCLNGITRRQVMAQARRLKIPVQEKTLTPAILAKSEAAFLTNSLLGIKPVETILS